MADPGGLTIMGILKRLDNADILYSDKEVMLHFYHEVLDLPFLFPTTPEEDWFALQAGDVSLFFFPGKGAHAEPLSASGADNPPGIESIAWAVDDLEAAIEALDPHIEWASETTVWTHPNGAFYRMRTFFDPEGNKLWITEPHRA